MKKLIILLLFIPLVSFGQEYSNYYGTYDVNANVNVNANINKNVNVTGNVTKTVTTIENNSVQLDIDLADKNYTVNGHAVESVTLYTDADCYGDLAVNWEEEDDSNYVHNTSMLMRDTDDSNNNTETMGEFYWERAFNTQLQAILLEAGFSTQAVADVSTSEWGMQDVGRASYDANEIAEEIFACYNLQYEDA